MKDYKKIALPKPDLIISANDLHDRIKLLGEILLSGDKYICDKIVLEVIYTLHKLDLPKYKQSDIVKILQAKEAKYALQFMGLFGEQIRSKL